MLKRIMLLLLLLLASQAYAAQKTTALIASSAPDYPPFNWSEQQQLSGFSIDLLKMICKNIKQPCAAEYRGSWATVLHDAKAGNIDVVTAIFKNQQREKYLAYTTPYMEDPIVVFVPAKSKTRFDRWTNLIGLRGVALKNASFGLSFDGYAKKRLTITRIKTIHAGLKALLDKKADYFICDLYPVKQVIYSEKLTNKIGRLKKPVFTRMMYMAFSRKSKFEKLRSRFSNQISNLKRNGTIKQLLKKNDDIPVPVQDKAKVGYPLS